MNVFITAHLSFLKLSIHVSVITTSFTMSIRPSERLFVLKDLADGEASFTLNVIQLHYKFMHSLQIDIVIERSGDVYK